MTRPAGVCADVDTWSPHDAAFTVTAVLDRSGGAPQRIPAPNPQAAAEITGQLLSRDPRCRAQWGPTTSSDGRPWPVQVFVRYQATHGDQAGAVHLALLTTGHTVGGEVPACCGAQVPQQKAEFTLHGDPCPRCLTYWRLAHELCESEGDRSEQDTSTRLREEGVDGALLDRLLAALRAGTCRSQRGFPGICSVG
ncbi:hypothetical protein [Haloactinomyces albus]|uniref:Uncharacterized protein n=1 Tax=Haloactinomyces albus TaxID=1352928 RepID=A0AAE3Z9X3_9ACTN|nr:hypothetical protein [Haloactinomyces albus]MDR7300030.1 hypothetical protein [Haloactinomyces albus]